jgi:hypothetical protein
MRQFQLRAIPYSVFFNILFVKLAEHFSLEDNIQYVPFSSPVGNFDTQWEPYEN